ncbi:hypothetical protein NNO58_14355 [Enterococcus faecium]|nr:hypothetical protein [Enterococcus faecium]HAP8117017.1 hypothetical protein [Enterococcus faecium]
MFFYYSTLFDSRFKTLQQNPYSDIAERLTVKKGEREGQKGVSLVTVQKAFQSKTNLESDRWKEIVKVATKLIEERQNDQNKA